MATIEKKYFDTRYAAEGYLINGGFDRYNNKLPDGLIWIKQPSKSNKCQLWARIYLNIDDQPDHLEDVSRCFLQVYERTFNPKQ